MARKRPPTVGEEMGTASAENDAAEMEHEAALKKLEAAKMKAQARAINQGFDPDESSDDQADPEYTTPSEADLIPNAAPSAEPSKLDRILMELNGDGKMEVYKMVGGSNMKVGVFPISEWPDIMEQVAREHGGGHFKVKFKDPRGQYVGSDTQTFDPKAYGKEMPSGNGEVAYLSRMLEMQQAREDRLMVQIESLRAEQTKMMLSFMESMRAQAPRERAAEEVIAMMKATRDLGGDKESPLESVKGILEVVAMLNNHGVGEAPSPVNLAIDKAFQLAGPLLGAWAAKVAASGAGSTPAPARNPGQGRPALPSPRAQALPPPATMPSAPPSVQVQLVAPPQAPNQLAQYAQSLLAAAGAGQSYESVANAILDMVPEENLDELEAMVNDPGFVAQMLACEPKLVAHQAWLVGLCNSIKSSIVPAEGAAAEVSSPSAPVQDPPAATPAEAVAS